jgi:hypothetical protein
MFRFIAGIFIILHGLVHLLYSGHSRRIFELQPGMTWPEGSWSFSNVSGNDTTRLIAGISCLLAAIGFVTCGIIILIGQAWWQSIVTGTSAFSAIVFMLFWNGKMQNLDNQGGIGLIINIAMIITSIILQ